MRVFGVFVALLCTVCFFTLPAECQSMQTLNSCPDPVAYKEEIANEVLAYFMKEVHHMEDALAAANESFKSSHHALAQCFSELESAKSLKQARLSYAGKMAKQVASLEVQKDASKLEVDRAQQLLNAAKTPHASSQQHAAAARQRANEALNVAQERSREAALAWAEANALQQQSNQWVQGNSVQKQSNQWVQGNSVQQQSNQWVQGTTNVKGSLTIGVPQGLQTAGSYVPQPIPSGRQSPIQTKAPADASKLAEIAKAAEYAAAVAESEAKRLNDIASAAERSVQSDWNNMSPSYHSFTHAQKNYQAICEAYAHQKAAYDAAILGIGAADTLILQKKEAITQAQANLAAELEKIPYLEIQLAAVKVVVKYIEDFIRHLDSGMIATPVGNTAPLTATSAPSAAPNNQDRGTASRAATGGPLMEVMRRLSSQANGRQSNTTTTNRAAQGGQLMELMRALSSQANRRQSNTRTANRAVPGGQLMELMRALSSQANGRQSNTGATNRATLNTLARRNFRTATQRRSNTASTNRVLNTLMRRTTGLGINGARFQNSMRRAMASQGMGRRRNRSSR